jgi:AraC-like DNA-binding protein
VHRLWCWAAESGHNEKLLGTVKRLRLQEGDTGCMHLKCIPGASLGETSTLRCELRGVARELGMSASGFHHHFRALTAMSPLQLQKELRLQEARRLMHGEGLDAASARYWVGYDDARSSTASRKSSLVSHSCAMCSSRGKAPVTACFKRQPKVCNCAP